MLNEDDDKHNLRSLLLGLYVSPRGYASEQAIKLIKTEQSGPLLTDSIFRIPFKQLQMAGNGWSPNMR